MAVDNFVLVSNTLFVTMPYVIIGYHDKMDAMNTDEWLGSVRATDEPFCTASKRVVCEWRARVG